MGLTKLSDDQIKEKLKELPGWELKNGKLHKEFHRLRMYLEKEYGMMLCHTALLSKTAKQ